MRPVLIWQGTTIFSLRLPPHSFPQDLAIIDRSRPDWEWLATAVPDVCPSGFVDPELKDTIEKEFMKRKEFMLVDSPEKADLVFLIEGTYVSTYTTGNIRSTPSGAQGGERRVIVISGITASAIPRGSTGSASTVLQAAVAIVVPSDVYMRSPADSEALLAARLWAGAALGMHGYTGAGGFMSAEAGDLVWEFAKQRKWPAEFPPLCAAWTLPSSSSNGLKASRNVPAMKSDRAEPAAPSVRAGDVPSGSETIHVDVTLVTVPTIVSDPDGKYIPGLRANDFCILENGMEQRIDRVIPESEPFHVVLLLDVSGSTTLKHDEIQMAAEEFVQALRPEDRVMVVSFSNLVRVDSEFTNDHDRLCQAILKTTAGGGTRLYDALDLVVTERLKQIQGRKAIVLFTDGVDTVSRLAGAASSLARIDEADALVYVIQYNTKNDLQTTRLQPEADYARGAEYLKNLTDHSGGRLFKAETVPSLKEAFSQIALELKSQYTLCYYPSNQSNDSAFRRIRVTLDRPGARIRARAGYRVATPLPEGK
jgi:VWFA-related protein